MLASRCCKKVEGDAAAEHIVVIACCSEAKPASHKATLEEVGQKAFKAEAHSLSTGQPKLRSPVISSGQGQVRQLEEEVSPPRNSFGYLFVVFLCFLSSFRRF